MRILVEYYEKTYTKDSRSLCRRVSFTSLPRTHKTNARKSKVSYVYILYTYKTLLKKDYLLMGLMMLRSLGCYMELLEGRSYDDEMEKKHY